MHHTNPFNFKTLSVDAPFCNRTKEIEKLVHAAESGNDVVLYAPRRYGKTSLIKRTQNELADRGFITAFADLSGVASVTDVARKLATAIYVVTRQNEPLWGKALRILESFRPVIRPTVNESELKCDITVEAAAGRTGFELLEAVMKEIKTFAKESGKSLNIAFDEFQDIVVLPEAYNIEACIRSHIQQYSGSHFFIGSQRRILSAMFNEEQRPFFRSAMNMHLVPLPKGELIAFIRDMFTNAGKDCDEATARYMAEVTKCHPYYTQKYGHFIFELADTAVTSGDVYYGRQELLADSRPYFESLIRPLPPQQRLVLRAIAKEPTDKVMAKEYMRKYELGSTSAISLALKQLSALDHIEQGENGIWSVVDPIFCEWITIQYL